MTVNSKLPKVLDFHQNYLCDFNDGGLFDRTLFKRKITSPDILQSVVKIGALHELDCLVQLSDLLLLLGDPLLELVGLVQELRLLLGQLHQVVGVAGQLGAPRSALQLHRKKRFTSFPSPAGMSLTKLPLGRNNSVMTS
jgi:hypothetical protein